MATLEDIVAATKILSDDPDSEMGVSSSKGKEEETRVSNLMKCDGVSDSDAVVSELVVQSEVIVESSIEVNGSMDELVKSCNEEKEIAENENSLGETGECKSTGDEQLHGSGTDVMDVDGDGCEGGSGEKMDDEGGAGEKMNDEGGAGEKMNDEGVADEKMIDEGVADEKMNGEGVVDEKMIDEGVVDEKMNGQDNRFHVGDFVWGKIKSHPWWPGQVYDPKDASEFAMTRKQEGRLLVAFFGDGSCSWCSPSQLIPFVGSFSEMSTDSSSKSFLNAVQRATDEVGRLMELEMTCKCIPEEKKDSLAKPEVTNAGLRAGIVMPEVDVRRLSLPEYEPADVLDRVMHLAKVVSVGNALDIAVLRSWLSAFYYFKGGHRLPVYHGPFHIEGLEDKNRDANGATEDFSVPIEVPILGPQEDDWLSSPTARSVNSQAASENKVLHKRKQRSVAELMGENKTTKPENGKVIASVKEGSDVEKSTTSRKRKKDSNEGEVKEAGSEQPSSTGKRGRKRKTEVSVSPIITDAKDDGLDSANGGKLSRKPKEIDVSAAENSSEVRDDSETVYTPRERKKSKYLSPPYTNLAWRLGNSSFKSEAQVENGEATKTIATREDHTEEQDIAKSQSITKSVDNGPTGSVGTSVDTGTRTVKDGKKLSFPVSDVDVSVNELLLDIQHAALDTFYLSKKGSLDMVWGFVSALRSSTYLHGTDYKIYRKCKTDGNGKSMPSQPRDVSSKLIEEKTAKLPDQSTPIASKKQRKSKTSVQTIDAKIPIETEKGITLPCLNLSFTPGFPLPSKKEVVELFGKFGSLNMKKTKVQKDKHSIRIVYTNDTDAEAAFKSSSSHCPFGSKNVSYLLQRCSPSGSKSGKSHPKVSSPPHKRTPEKRKAEDLVSDLNTIKQKLEITTAIVENYHSRFSSEDKSSLKDEMKQLMEKIETVGDMVRVIAEKSTC